MLIRTLTLAVLLLPAAAILAKGPLNPPVGAIATTGKTLTEVEPRIAVNETNTPGTGAVLFNITEPGSYYLTSDVVGVAGKSGIWLSTGNIRLDLNGFTVRGATGSGTGIMVASSSGGLIEISNGVVTGWGQHGLALQYYAPVATTVRNVRSVNNHGDGIAASSKSRIENCFAYNNDGDGISAFEDSHITGCTASTNGGDGIAVGAQAKIDRCIATDNGGRGVAASVDATVTNSTANDNIGTGIELGSNGRASMCTATENSSYGFFVGASSVISECTARANATSAVRANGTFATITKCTLEGVASFPVVTIDPSLSVRITDNYIAYGTFAVAAGSVPNAFVTGNQCISQSSGAFSLPATAQVGPTVTAGGVITSNSPFANFVR